LEFGSGETAAARLPSPSRARARARRARAALGQPQHLPILDAEVL